MTWNHFLILLMIFIIVVALFYEEKEKFIQEIPMRFYSFWGDLNNDENIKKIFRKLFSHVKNYKEIHIYSVFGDPPSTKDPNILYVQFSGESNFHDPKIFDINFIPAIPTSNNKVVIFPYGAFQTILNTIYYSNYNIDRLLEPREYTNSENFCLFSVTNGNCWQRNSFFEKLSEYKKVDSCGSYMNNLGYKCPKGHSSPEYLEFIGKYKFMICFENTSQPNYFTEKLINAYYGGTIPIYWGDPLIFDKVNPEAILYLKPDFTSDDVRILINEIRRLDTDENAYRKKHSCPLFLNGEMPDCFIVEQIADKVQSLL